MIEARRHCLMNRDLSHASHGGLVYSRFLKHAADKGTDGNDAKAKLMSDAISALTNGRAFYESAYNRWKLALPLKPCLQWDAITQTRLIIGLGGENVTETGLTLNHTYGVPYLPGTALKGLAAHYAHQVWGALEVAWKIGGTYHKCLFGTTDEGGLIQFFDAWIAPESLSNCLLADVMTPHHGDYYMSSDANVAEPTDFDSPVPVPFLSVQGTFHLAVSTWASNAPDIYLDYIKRLLTEALATWGIGGKTSSGYGRLVLTA